MEGVVGRARAYDFGVDGRAARLSVLEAFQHEQARAFTHDKAVAVLVKGAGSLFGIVVVRRGERLQRGKAGNAHGVTVASTPPEMQASQRPMTISV